MSVLPVDGASVGEDAERGKLFDVPRIGILLDESDPTVLKLAFSGSVEFDRSNASQVEFYNRLLVAAEDSIVVTVYAVGTKKTHRRDTEGDVDAIVETKSLVVSDVFVDDLALELHGDPDEIERERYGEPEEPTL
jgi:hypothetical protein